jgi:hypothetical protein
MPRPPRNLATPSAAGELLTLVVVGWLAMVCVPLGLGGIGLSWDALNHHVYLGWTAEKPRFDRDFLAASYQAFQYPYLYWPFYKLYQSGLSGQWAGAILVTLNVFAVPALWMIARICVPEPGWYGVAMRWLAVWLAFFGGVVLSMFDTTANDLLAAIPFVWAVALAVQPFSTQQRQWLSTTQLVAFSGLCAGVAVAFKLSNGFVAILMPMLWCLHGPSLARRVLHVAIGSFATVVGLVLAYGSWGWELWTHFGNPIYPFYDPWFAPLRAWLGWQP